MSVFPEMLPDTEELINFNGWAWCTDADDIRPFIEEAAVAAIRGDEHGISVDTDELDKVVSVWVESAIRETFRGGHYPNTLTVSFPWQWKGVGQGTPQVDNPMEIHVGLPFGDPDGDGSEPTWKLTLTELVEDVLENFEPENFDPEEQVEKRAHLEKFVVELEAVAAFARGVYDKTIVKEV